MVLGEEVEARILGLGFLVLIWGLVRVTCKYRGGDLGGMGEQEIRWIFINILISPLATSTISVCWLTEKTKITSVNWIMN